MMDQKYFRWCVRGYQCKGHPAFIICYTFFFFLFYLGSSSITCFFSPVTLKKILWYPWPLLEKILPFLCVAIFFFFFLLTYLSKTVFGLLVCHFHSWNRKRNSKCPNWNFRDRLITPSVYSADLGISDLSSPLTQAVLLISLLFRTPE